MEELGYISVKGSIENSKAGYGFKVKESKISCNSLQLIPIAGEVVNLVLSSFIKLGYSEENAKERLKGFIDSWDLEKGEI